MPFSESTMTKRPIKRALDDNNSEDERFRIRRSGGVCIPKIRTGVQLARDFPPGGGNLENSVGSKTARERRVLGDIESKVGNITSSGNVQKRRNEAHAQKSKEIATAVSQSSKDQIRREEINDAMTRFNEVYERLFEENRVKPKGEKIAHWRVTGNAAKIVKKKMKWMDADKEFGPISGVQVGDKFRFRSQLQMIGLHCQPQSGIDYKMIEKENLAISIVDSNRYPKDKEFGDVLYYSGQGGIAFLGSKKAIPEDQELERGNLALKNSSEAKNLVRVIRKLREVGKRSKVFVYDGLYTVENYTQKTGGNKKMAFMFKLNKKPGQPQLEKMLKC